MIYLEKFRFPSREKEEDYVTSLRESFYNKTWEAMYPFYVLSENNFLSLDLEYEIKVWLSKHGDEVSNYAIIDDMDDILPEQQPHFVWTDEEKGLTEENAVQAIMILNHLLYVKEDISRS